MSREGSPREKPTDESASTHQPLSVMDAGSVDTQVTPDAQTQEVLNSENELSTSITLDSTQIPSLPELTQENNEQQEEQEEEEGGGGEADEQTTQIDQQDIQPEQITTVTDNENQDIVEKPEHESPPRLPDTFYYDAEKIHAKPLTTNEATFPQNTLTMFRSFAYDCDKRGNLHILDNKTVMFAAACVIEIIDLPSGQHRYIQTTGGYSIGAVVVHPNRQYFAVGEKGDIPNIVIYEYPSLRPYRILKAGTQRSYAYLDFNTEGDLLASLGSSPDYMLTIWDWRDEKILLRSKASSQEVFKVSFSKDLKGHLTTSGIGHIKFWKMARTFTGLKLQGELGRFGRTEISDIEGYRELPDGKVISGTEWGNMLLWDGGLIQIEVCRKKGKPCHNGPIQQVLLNESDVYTVGEDGYIRIWDFETIDTAEAIDEGSKMEMEPLNELRVGTDSKLMGIKHGVVDDMSLWFAQDARGNIWKLDLTFSKNSVDPEVLLSFTSGAVTGLDTSSVYHMFTCSAGNTIRIYNILTQEILSQKMFVTNVTSLKWLPTVFDEKSDGILVGFSDGVIRYFKLRSGIKPNGTEKKFEFDLRMIQVLKPHTKSVTFITVEVKNQWIATGSTDGTVFFFNFTPKGLNPIGFVNVNETITFMTWTPAQYDKTCLLVCLNNGVILEYEGPGGIKFDTSTSYLIETQLPVRIFRFRSIKSRLRHEEELERKRKEEEERQRKLEEERRLRGIEKKEKEGERPTEQEEEEKKEEDDWKPYIPETPSAALFAAYTSPDTFWLSMVDNYDAGYLYHCQFSNKDDRFQYNPERQDTIVNTLPVPNTDLADGNDIPLTSILIREKLNLIFVGLKNGFIRIYPYGGTQIFQSLDDYWTRGSHDTEYGIVTHLITSFDDRFAFSGGADGNIFGYVVKGDLNIFQEQFEIPKMPAYTGEIEPQDITEPKHYSIEEEKQRAEQDKMKKSAEGLKSEMRQRVEGLRGKFRRLLIENDQLPADLRIARQDFILDENIRQNFLAELQDKIDLSVKELAWESERCNVALRKLEQWFVDPVAQDVVSVKSFDGQWEVSTFRTIELPKDFYSLQEEIERQKNALLDKGKRKETIEISDEKAGESREARTTESKSSTTKLKGAKAMRVERLLRKMEERAKRRQKRKEEWTALYQKKKPEGYADPVEVENIRYAKDNMGNYFLKSASDYVVPVEQRLTVLRALDRIMKLRFATYTYKMKFNQRVLDLIQRKRTLTEQINNELVRLRNLGQSQPNYEELFNIPLLPSVHDGQENRFHFTREEIQAFREEHEQRNGDLTKPDEDSSNTNTRQSSIKRPIDLRWSVNLKEPLPSNILNRNRSNETTTNDNTPINILREVNDPENSNFDPFTYRSFFERDQILENVKETMRTFDNDVCLLYYLKMIKTLRAKETDLRCITFYEELMLMKEFERTENDLENKVVEAQKRFDNEQTKINEFNGKIDLKKKDIENLDERMKHIYARFDEMIPKEHKFYNYLLRVLNKKIKRKKRVEGEEADDADDMSQDLDEEEDWELEDEEDEDQIANEDPTRQLDVDICPPNLDQKVYDDVVALREKRLDLDEAITDEKSVLQSLQQTLGQTQIYSNKIDAELKSKQADLIDFQKKKQRKINDINVAIGIRCHQIRYDRSTHLPDDLSDALIFNRINKLGLTNRIVDVKTEIKREKERYVNKKQERKDLSHELKHAAQVIKLLTDECNKLMVEKFGKLVQLEKLEGAIVNLQIEELKQKLDDAGDEYYNTMTQYELLKIEEHDDTIDLLKTNTKRLDELTQLVDEKRLLDEQLVSRKTKAADEFTGPSKQSIEEFDRLCTLVQLQAQEIEALKAEISILSRKGGHILPPNPAILPQNS
ncbi:unnamed protein product [Rotaria sordida]|uniref:Cilia- and flagella-associated protein 44 n=1 Tax=Rotaria sordida TaxID=392033 RepID=A0A813PTJ8_9BILA|nr:unnamed protein product [Rotaria sordida]